MVDGATSYSKPLPLMQGLNGQFYEHCKQKQLCFQRCKQCAKWRHVPRVMCAACGSWEWEGVASKGRGKVFTWTVVRRPMHPAFKDDAPYAPVVVQMDEGVRLVTSLIDCTPDEIQRGMPVEVVFDAVTPDVTLPKFRRVRS